MITYDTVEAVKRYQNKYADHLGIAVQLLLDLWNLIIRIAAELAKTQSIKK